ncbi:hypothetical protein CKAH01_16890 [Colletotrichum kahawae]|uniref:Uncharacterized protein n=1 Tax=Colletotrichum kahawae TaxID=34407 RepID=A0AAD9YCR1_COLKA|nr:hypothetical protein CKAH01_16890 [Colletotrichum kahawae]
MSYQGLNPFHPVPVRVCSCGGDASQCPVLWLKHLIVTSFRGANDPATLQSAISNIKELLECSCGSGMQPCFFERDSNCPFNGSLLPNLLDQRCSAQVFEVFLRHTGYVDLKHPYTLGILQRLVESVLRFDRCDENKLDEHSRQKIDLILFAISSKVDPMHGEVERELTFNLIKPWLMDRCRWAAYPPPATYPPTCYFPAFLGLLDAMISCFWDNRHRVQRNVVSRTIYDDTFWFSLLEMLWTDRRVINGTMCRLIDISRRLLDIGKEMKERGMCANRDPFPEREFSTMGRRGWKLRDLVKKLREGEKGNENRRIAAAWSDDVEEGFRILGGNQVQINFDVRAARMRKNSWLEMGRLMRS